MKNKRINLASLKKSLQLFLLFFIVFSSTIFAQTGHWEKLNPPVSPSARLAYGMSSIGNEQALLFSGKSYSGSGTQYFGDTWLFDYQNKIWTELKPKDSPKMRTYFLESNGYL